MPLAAHAEARSSTPESDLPPGALALVPDAPTMASPMIKALAERCQVQVMGLAEILSELSWSTLELRIRGGEFRAPLIEFPSRTFKSGLRSSLRSGSAGQQRRSSDRIAAVSQNHRRHPRRGGFWMPVAFFGPGPSGRAVTTRLSGGHRSPPSVPARETHLQSGSREC